MIISNIQKEYDNLTPVERKVAAFVFSAPEKVTKMTVSQLAECCNVAPSAVIRFCKSIGLSGYSELKITLARELGFQKGNVQMPEFDQGEETERVVRKVFHSSIQNLQNTMALLDFELVEKMADSMAKAKRIFLFGVGTSSIVAVDAQYRLSQLGLWATACTDVLVMNVTAANLGPEDLVLAISHSGRTKIVVDAVRHAKRAKAATLAITSHPNSLLAKVSDISIAVHADDDRYPVEAVSARMAHICLIDSLMMVLATKNFDDFTEHIKVRNKILGEIRYKN